MCEDPDCDVFCCRLERLVNDELARGPFETSAMEILPALAHAAGFMFARMNGDRTRRLFDDLVNRSRDQHRVEAAADARPGFGAVH